ncbi:MAG: hypothetical protein JNG88_12465 [Phycisphaerales bacterium]|nr:hypothetical protein [Phycisphaerales bacterium]
MPVRRGQRSRPSRVGKPLLTGLIAAALLMVGCGQQLGAMLYFLSPQRMHKPEIELTKARLAILIEFADPSAENPVFARALHDIIEDQFTERKLKSKVVPCDELARLRSENADFSTWSVQRIGRRVNAEQVLYIRVESFIIHEEPGHPLIEPKADMRLKVIDARASAKEGNVQLWPPEPDGRRIALARPPKDAGSSRQIDDEVKKLARQTGRIAARIFVEHDEEEELPREP